MPEQTPVAEPFPIHCVSGRYLLYDVNVVSHIREKHHMCGCLTGTLPQVPQQNVFLGLPLQLMTEEAALLVEKGAAYIVDDKKAHLEGLKAMMEADKQAYLARRKAEADADTAKHVAEAEERKKAFAHKPGYKKVKGAKGQQKHQQKKEGKKEESLFDFGTEDRPEDKPAEEPIEKLEEKLEKTPGESASEPETIAEPEPEVPVVEDTPPTLEEQALDDKTDIREAVEEVFNAARLPLFGQAPTFTEPLDAPVGLELLAEFVAARLPLFGSAASEAVPAVAENISIPEPAVVESAPETDFAASEPTETSPAAFEPVNIAAQEEPAAVPEPANTVAPVPESSVPKPALDAETPKVAPTPGKSSNGVVDPAALRFYNIESVSDKAFHKPTPSTDLIPQPKASSYPVYRHLQSQGYYLSPGLRFGCQFMAYPGDPLRFHSHFVVNGLDWDEEIDVLDVVGGGRLGTGVKKAWMIGGMEKKDGGKVMTEDGQEKVRTFCVEWGGF